jgi:hypothetical protein
MHKYDNQRDLWLPLSDAFYECMAHRYMAIIERINHRLERLPRDYKEITLFWEWRETTSSSRKITIPTSGEISLFIIAYL